MIFNCNLSLGFLFSATHHGKTWVFLALLWFLGLHNFNISKLFFVCFKDTDVLIFSVPALINQDTPLFDSSTKIDVSLCSQIQANK